MLRTNQVLAAVAVAFLSAACSDDPTGPPAGPEPEYLGAEATVNPNNAISSEVVVQAALYDSVEVRYWATGIAVETTPAHPFSDDSAVVPVLGLHAAAAYSFEVVLFRSDSSFIVDTLDFTSGSLPAWIPAAAAAGTDTTPGFVVLSYPDGPVIVNNVGRVVWYRHFPGGVLNSFQVHRNGAMTLQSVTDPSTRFHQLDLLGNDLGTFTCQNYGTRFHDLLVLPGGDRYMLCDEFRDMDLTAVGGLDSVRVQGTVIQHIGADGQLLFEWKALDHFQITDLPLSRRTGTDVNFTHGNGIAVDHDGNLLLSSRSLDEITKINRSTGAVIWRLGGLANQFTFLNDQKGSFQQQHGIRVGGPGEIQVLDNGTSAPSRLVKYLVDPVAMTVLMLYQFIDSPTTFTAVGGSTQYIPLNGRSLVSYGREGRVVEVDATGHKRWEVTGIDDIYVFRAQRIRSLYDPGSGY